MSWSDVGLAILLSGFGVGGTGGAAANQGVPDPDLRAYILVVFAAAVMVFWRSRPAWSFVGVGAAVVVYLALGYPYGPILITGVIAVYALTSRVPVRVGLIATTSLIAAYELATVIRVTHDHDGWGALGSVAGWVIVPAAVGIAVQIRRGSAVAVRAEQARRAVSEERLRMAQELHDVVGHGLAVIAMQAGVAMHVLDRSPDKARESLEAIRATSREALDGLRAELDLLRATEIDGASDEAGVAPRRPMPGLDDVEVLIGRIRAGGMDVDLHVSDGLDGPGAVPVGVGAAAYRILQESLTNVLRHANTDAASVRLQRVGDVLVLEVADRGAGGLAPGDEESGAVEKERPPGSGTGIPGMRRRAEDLGGTLEAGPRPGGGFVVRARLPVDDLPGSPS